MWTKKVVAVFLFVGISLISASSINLTSKLTEIIDEAEKKSREHREIIDNAFEQRTKTQKMARDALLVSIEFKKSIYQKDLIDTAEKFDKKFISLIENKNYIDNVVEKLPEFQKRVEDFKKIWKEFYKNIKIVSEEHKDKKALSYIVDNNLELLESMDYILYNFLKLYNVSDELEAYMAHIQTITLSQVGKPRMYVTKIVKEKLLIDMGIDAEKNKRRLKESIESVDKIMRGIEYGDEKLELDGTEDSEILKKLSESSRVWREFKELIKKDKLEREDIERVVSKNEEFIKKHTEVFNLIRVSIDN